MLIWILIIKDKYTFYFIKLCFLKSLEPTEWDTHSLPHQKHIVENRHDLAAVIRNPVSLARDLHSQNVINKRELELVQEKGDAASCTLQLMEIISDKSVESYNELLEILSRRQEEEALDTLGN